MKGREQLSPLVAALSERLAVEAGPHTRTDVVLTDNRVRMASVRRQARGRLELRVARRLLEFNGRRAVEPLVGFAVGRGAARHELRRLVAEVPELEAGKRRATVLRPMGRHHHLVPILREEGLAHLGAVPAVQVTWGPRRRLTRGQRTIRLGSYHAPTRVIRLHRLLDQPSVPRWLVGFVVYHELLHDVFGIDESGARRVIHPPAFRAREAQHPRYEDAQRWEREERPRLMAGAR